MALMGRKGRIQELWDVGLGSEVISPPLLADLNGDGKVDFIDFTMFSAVYGQVFTNTALPVGNTGQGLNPITPAPDSTISPTSSINP